MPSAHTEVPSTHWACIARTAAGLIAASVSLSLAACTAGNLAGRGFKEVSVTYQYTDQNRSTRESRALLNAQDQCYFAGFQYAEAAGPPKTVSEDATSGEHQATRAFYCIGLRGGEG